MKPGKTFFYILLGVLTAILIALGLLHTQIEKIFYPVKANDIADFIMFAAVGIMLWNRKVLGDEKKAAAARKLQEEEEAAARQVKAEDPYEDAADEKSGTDAPL
jgi:hypothetical protein